MSAERSSSTVAKGRTQSRFSFNVLMNRSAQPLPSGSRTKAGEPSMPRKRISAWKSWLIPTALIADRSGPLAAGDRGQAVGRRRQPVPGLAAGRDDRLVVRPDAMAELVVKRAA